MALALYRRYRPDTFDGVIGQDQVTVPLMRALDENKLTHAYLFSGPRGCGKTSSARILARCVNCAKGPTSHPCGECASCKDLATGGPGSIDVVEIDAASHNGVDDARELRERAGFAPARDRYKIFILDEAHMVTPQGFNALLKIVEEPPEHVMFIFATTEPDKVIGTIRSRTHHYPFRLVPQEVMGPYLERICADEHIEAEPGVLRLAMRAGGGSVRDTLSVLDQLMIGSVDGKIPYDSAVALLGFTPDALIGEAIDAVADKNGEALYGVIQKVVVGGFEPRRFVEDLLSRVRDLLVLTLGGERAESVLSDDAAAENMDDLHRQAKALGLAALTQMADTINTALAGMTGAISPRMRLELLAARLLAGREVSMISAVPATASPADAPVAVGGAEASRNAAESASPRYSMAGSRRRAQQAASKTASEPNTTTDQLENPKEKRAEVRPSTTPTNAADAVASGAASVLAEVKQVMGETSHEAQNTGHQAVSMTSQPSVPVHDDRTPDQRWDALVAGLPDDVRLYVNREKVPRILLDEKTSRLWIKFDKPLSKYAFAKAVAKESVDGTTDVVSIVRAEVRKIFGPGVTLAPARKLADGSQSIPWSKLSPEEQARIKAQLVQEQLKAATQLTASLGGATVADEGKEPSSQHKNEDETAGSASDDDAHRVAAPAISDDPWSGDASPSAALDDDPWHVAAAQQTSSAAESGVESNAKPTAAPDAESDIDDPWGMPVRQSPQADASWNGGNANRANSPEHHAKHVAVPNIDDGVDPWAVPLPTPQGDGSMEATSPRQPVQSERSQPAPSSAADDPWGAPMPVQAGPEEPRPIDRRNDLRHQAMANANHGAQQGNDPWSQRLASDTPAKPEVAAEDDEYSMNDESLGSSNAMSVQDLSKLFEVKKVEDFTADDPRNPRNMHVKKTLETND